MKSLMMFIASCGHNEIRSLTDEEWEKWTTPKMFPSFPSGKPIEVKNPTRIGRKTRMVYITPFRYTCCSECATP